MSIEPLPEQHGDIHSALVGTWSLASRQDHLADGTLVIDPHLGADPLGMLTFTTDRFAAQFSRRDRAAAEASTVAAASGTNTSAVGGYDAYFGTYAIGKDSLSVIVTLQASISPQNVGSSFSRDARVVGDRLWLRLPTSRDDGTPITRTLQFDRLP